MRFHENQLNKASNNFDLLRLLAAVLVLVGHAPLIRYGKHYDFDVCNYLFHHGAHAFGLVLFFIISGFLVSASWEKRPALFSFFKARVLRIYPGLFLATILTVFLLGPLLSSLNWKAYFAEQQTWKYLFNVTLIRISHFLPGVFEGNHLHGVNGSLWSLPYEFFCYTLVPLFALLPAMFRKKGGLLIVLLALTLCYVFYEDQVNAFTIPLLDLHLGVSAHYFLYFIAAACYFQLRSWLVWRWWIALAVVLLSVLWPYFAWSDYLLVFTLPYLILYLAMGLPKLKSGIDRLFDQLGDLSYGICLYAFPVQQVLVSFFPQIHFFLFLFITLLITGILAWLSWRLIEAPALKLKF